MGLGHRKVDQYVAVENVLHHFDPFKDLPLWNLDFTVKLLVLEGHDMNPAERLAGVPDPGPFETEFSPLERMVENHDLLGSCLHASLSHGCHHGGMGRAAPLRGIGKGHV